MDDKILQSSHRVPWYIHASTDTFITISISFGYLYTQMKGPKTGQQAETAGDVQRWTCGLQRQMLQAVW